MFSRPLPPTCAALARVSVVKWTCLLALPLVLPAQPIPTIPAIPTIQRSPINSSSPSAVFKLAINASLSQLKAQIQVSKKAFFDDLKTYETAIHDGQLVTTWTSTLHESCVTFQIAVRDAAATAYSDIATAGATILDDLASGGPLNGVYPNDFYLGGGGLFDKANAAVRAQLEKLYPTIRIACTKTSAIAAKQGAALTVLLRPPAIPSEYYIAPGTDVHFGNRLGLDLLISLNRSAIESDGRVWLGAGPGPRCGKSIFPFWSRGRYGLDDPLERPMERLPQRRRHLLQQR